ncbi:DNA polymerase III subunit beta [Geobacter sp. SVR]|uniref:DNA polymerase III subunit beta n=1 Tax=Geobacter sp. SVR TaxID=2495594 RepID=UPI00143F0283|nr:DNA polymerase III subunit beta [Geobacter sp. SVR]BCS51694.1 DNA polymerase III subunit beta [Geobacter sp. SVR]GCF84881.1 DNA polymerase III subunit beta [Geobacter sp. SVR]
MEFRIDKEVFLKSLQKIQGIVEKRTSMPILSNALLEATESTLLVTATDLEVGMKSSYPADIVSPGKITVGAKKLYEIVKELPNQLITFATKDNDWVEIKCGKVHFNIVGLSPEEFPYFPAVKEENLFEIENTLLKDMIEKTSYAICNDDTKYNLNGLFTKVEPAADGSQTLKMVATDGHRLSIANGALKGTAGPELLKGVILPKKGIYELKKITEEDSGNLLFGFMENSAVIKRGDSYMVMRLVDGEFPDYNRVIPTANDRVVTVNKEAFTHSIRRMAILSSEKFKGIMLEISASSIKISSSNPELGDAMEEIDVVYGGEPLAVRFNARYLLDVLAVAETEAIEMKFRDELSPSIIVPEKSDSFLAVIMPMRL